MCVQMFLAAALDSTCNYCLFMLFQTSTSVLLGSTTVMLMLLVLTLLEVLLAPATLVSLVQERLAPVSYCCRPRILHISNC